MSQDNAALSTFKGLFARAAKAVHDPADKKALQELSEAIEPGGAPEPDALYGDVLMLVNKFALAGHISTKGVSTETCDALRALLAREAS